MPQRLKSDSTNESNDLRNAGLKVTLPRLKILEILADGAARHMSAEDIYKKLLVSNEDIGLATVYRVLTQFEAAGLVTRHHFEGGSWPTALPIGQFGGASPRMMACIRKYDFSSRGFWRKVRLHLAP